MTAAAEDPLVLEATRILESAGRTVDAALESWLPPADASPQEVHAAMRYAVLAPGKRFRPALLLEAARALGVPQADALPGACALELVHAFSLIHDDLPAMDDDSLRRGQPSAHVRYGEAVAILAGDALSALAFEILARETPGRELVPGLVGVLARALGTSGMIGGQVLDLLGEGRPPDAGLVEEIHARKTAALVAAACEMPALLAQASPFIREGLTGYGRTLGMAFQVADDLLDEVASVEQMGKETGRDRLRGKQTHPAAHGVEQSRSEVRRLVDRAVAELRRTLGPCEPLEILARYIASRAGA